MTHLKETPRYPPKLSLGILEWRKLNAKYSVKERWRKVVKALSGITSSQIERSFRIIILHSVENCPIGASTVVSSTEQLRSEFRNVYNAYKQANIAGPHHRVISGN